ncbi:MAG: hypothetical protein ACQER4_07275 [Bacteroidota bacterium]
MKSIGIVGLAGLLLAGGTLSCATSEPVPESSNEVETEEREPSGKEIYPEWFEPDIEGEMANGEWVGYGRAIASTEERSYELAQEQALEGLRYRIDRALNEESDRLSSQWTGAGSLSASLRSAVSNLDLSDVTWRSSKLDDTDEWTEAVVHVVEARISAENVSGQLQSNLESLPVEELFDTGSE